MYKQETIFYIDTFQIHITKDYVDNILIEEKHYTIDNKLYYVKDYINNIELKRFYFYDKEMEKLYKDYHYLLSIVDDNDITLKLYKPLIRFDANDIHNNHNSVTYTMTKDTCTHLCTLNNDDAIIYIKNYIKIIIMEKYNLI